MGKICEKSQSEIIHELSISAPVARAIPAAASRFRPLRPTRHKRGKQEKYRFRGCDIAANVYYGVRYSAGAETKRMSEVSHFK